MRIIYYQDKLLLSLTKSEIDEAYHAKGRPIELPIGNLLPLHKDINDSINQYVKDIHFYSTDNNYIKKEN